MNGQILDALRRPGYSRRDFNRMLGAPDCRWRPCRSCRCPSAAAAPDGFRLGRLRRAGALPAVRREVRRPPEFAVFGSEEEALQKMLCGFQVDLAHPCSYNIARWREARRLPADRYLAPHRIRQSSGSSSAPFPAESFDGQTYFVPLDGGNSSIVYRTDLVDPGRRRRSVLGAVVQREVQGRLAMYDTDTTLVEVAARVAGMYDDYQHLSDEQLAAVQGDAGEAARLLRFYWADNTQVEQAWHPARWWPPMPGAAPSRR